MTQRQGMPDWLRRLLEARGDLGPDGVTRTARTTFCRSCGSVVVRGLDAARCAFPATADPEPLNEVGEVLALLAGRATYELRWVGGRYELDARDRWAIAARPASGVHAVADHICAAPAPEAWVRTSGPVAAPPARGEAVGDVPAF